MRDCQNKMNRLLPFALTTCFAVATGIHILFGKYLSTGLAGAGLLAVLGAAALALNVRALIRQYRWATVGSLAASVASAALWITLPSEAIDNAVRFQLELPAYRAAAQELASSRQPACLKARACMVDGQRIIFEWDGMLSGWYGVVFDPSDNLADFLAGKPGFTAAILGCERLQKSYYLCGFS